MDTQNEFKAFGLTITSMTLGYGLLLVIWGVVFSIGSKSFTSYIPSMIGRPSAKSGCISQLSLASSPFWEDFDFSKG